MNETVYAIITAGSVEYAAEDAKVDINEFIAALEESREDGATHVIGLSGNFRGPQYVRLGLSERSYDEEI